jgi:hypothetical protein
MDAARVLQAFAGLGVSVKLGVEGRIVYEPNRDIPEELLNHARACRAQIVELLTNGHDAASAAPPAEPGGDVAEHLSDLANAKRLARLHARTTMGRSLGRLLHLARRGGGRHATSPVGRGRAARDAPGRERGDGGRAPRHRALGAAVRGEHAHSCDD